MSTLTERVANGTTTDADVRRARIFVGAGGMLGQWWEERPDLSVEDTIEMLAARLLWELAVDDDGILTADAAEEVYERIGLRLSELVD